VARGVARAAESNRLPRVLPGRREAAELVFNRLVTHLPHNELRLAYLRALGLRHGPHCFLFGSSEVICPEKIELEGYCHIGRYCQIDGRGGIRVGRNVVIASHTLLLTADHDVQSTDFHGRLGSIAIEDRVWLASRVTVLKGVTVGQGAVVAAGSVVHRDVPAWSIVSGVPAEKIGERNADQTYEISAGPRWY
jgi:putative colanic acid biosynthesis acetyltransferase WcaF